MERSDAKKAIESLLYMTDHALTPLEISHILDDRSYDEAAITDIIREIGSQLDQTGSGLRVMEVAGGFQMATRQETASFIRKLYKERLLVKLSASSMETLAIIAYKQPITRLEVEHIRGVEASGVMDTLVERRLIKVVGRKETIGRPLLYGTTIEFLRQFGLKHLSELPDISAMAVEAAEHAAHIPEKTEPDAPPELPFDQAAEAASPETASTEEAAKQTAAISSDATDDKSEEPTNA